MKTLSLLRSWFQLFIMSAFLIFINGCGGSGSTATSSNPVQPTTMMAIDTSLPLSVSKSITSVISPVENVSVGTAISVESTGGDTIVLATDDQNNIWLASVVTSSTTTLSADSTALALTRIAFGQLQHGISASQLNTIIQNTAGYSNLVSAVTKALTNGIYPVASPEVLLNISIVLSQMVPSLAELQAARISTIKQLALLATPTVMTPLPISIITLDTYGLTFPIGISNSNVDFVDLVNTSPMAWTAVGADNKPTLLPGNSLLSKALSNWIIIGIKPVQIGTGGKSFNLSIMQTEDSKSDNLADIMARIISIGLDAAKLSCSLEVLKNTIKPIINAEVPGIASVTMDSFKTYLATDAFSVKNILLVINGCTNIGLQNKIDNKDVLTNLQKYLYAITKVIGTISSVDNAASLVYEVKLVDLYSNYPQKTVGVCIGEKSVFGLFNFGGGVVNCAAELTYDPASVATVVGAKWSPNLTAKDSSQKATAIPLGLLYSQNDGGVVLTLDTSNGSIVVKDYLQATVTALDPSTNVSGTFSVQVVDPVIIPATLTMKIGETTSLSLQDGKGTTVKTDGAPITWYVDLASPAAVRIATLTVLGSPNTVQIEAIAAGTSDVVLFNQITSKSTKATVKVLDPSMPGFATSTSYNPNDIFNPPPYDCPVKGYNGIIGGVVATFDLCTPSGVLPQIRCTGVGCSPGRFFATVAKGGTETFTADTSIPGCYQSATGAFSLDVYWSSSTYQQAGWYALNGTDWNIPYARHPSPQALWPRSTGFYNNIVIDTSKGVDPNTSSACPYTKIGYDATFRVYDSQEKTYTDIPFSVSVP